MTRTVAQDAMTRVFRRANVPVTVLRSSDCQVVAVRRTRKDGYTALQLGAGKAKVKRATKDERGHFAVLRRSSPSASSPNSASSRRTTLIDVGAEITADHFVEGQFVDVIGTSIGKGFRRCDEAA